MVLDNKYKNKMGIYQIICTANNKIYIGQSSNIYNRFKDHRDKLRANKNHNLELQADYNMYGENNFKFEVLEIVEDFSLLDDLERKYIKIARNNQNGCYNRFSGGKINYEVPDDFKEKVSDRFLGKSQTEDIKQKHSEAAKKQWEDDNYRNTMIKSVKNQWKDDNYRQIMLNAHKGKEHPVKLTAEIVKECRERFKNGEKISALAKEFNVNYDAIYKVVHYKTWKCVD